MSCIYMGHYLVTCWLLSKRCYSDLHHTPGTYMYVNTISHNDLLEYAYTQRIPQTVYMCTCIHIQAHTGMYIVGCSACYTQDLCNLENTQNSESAQFMYAPHFLGTCTISGMHGTSIRAERICAVGLVVAGRGLLAQALYLD